MKHMAAKYVPMLILAALSACSDSVTTSRSEAAAGGAVAGCATRAYDHIGGPFELVDHTGAAVTEETFKGRHSLVFFGFTYCPDICPTTLVTIDRALQRLPDDMERPRTVLISVDPERDTPDAMAEYIQTPVFPDDITGLTGSVDAISAVAAAFSAGFTKVETPESLADYTMDHSTIIYLMDENWSLKTFFTHEATAEDIGTCLSEHLR